jgi:excisionase family DNA binding protein
VGLLTTSQAADLLGVAPQTLKNWTDAGRVPHHRTVSGHRRFEEATIVELSVSPIRNRGQGDVEGWRRAASALLRAAIRDTGEDTPDAARFQVALQVLTDPADTIPRPWSPT